MYVHDYNNVVSINICLKTFGRDSDSAYKEQKLNEVAVAVCALLNSNGGKIKLRFDDPEVKASLKSECIRIMEKAFKTFAGADLTFTHIDFVEHEAMIVVKVKKSVHLITLRYHMYLPTETQVVAISGVNARESIKDAIENRTYISNPSVKLGSHEKRFNARTESGIPESKMVQFKCLKSDASERTTLADRLTGNGSKFSSYVSAFANYSGGHIYYGIDDDGVVEGQIIPSEKDNNEITVKVEKAINKMIWPKQMGRPKRGKHWEIFFEQVVDKNSKPIPSTFVMVIFIAPCLGGVFTEEPECYEMLEGKVKKISFATWKKRLVQPDGSDTKYEIPATVQRISGSSSETKRLCTEAEEVLMAAINNGEWEKFSKAAKTFEHCLPHKVEIQLIVLSKRVIANYRRGCLAKARLLLLDYNDLLPKTKDHLIFEAIHLYLKAALKRVRGNFEAGRQILAGALSMTELIPPGIVTAAIFSFAALMYEGPGNDISLSPDTLCTKALEHLMYVERPSKVKVDLENKAHITLASFKLGLSAGKIIKKDINKLELKKAESSLIAVNEAKNSLNQYRKIQLIMAKSTLYHRYSQFGHEKQEMLLKSFQYSKEAEDRARNLKFDEMIQWARAIVALCSEGLSTLNSQADTAFEFLDDH